MKVQNISAGETIDLRSRILRPSQPIEICHYPEDQFPTTFHLGIIDQGKIICNGTFIQQAHENFSASVKPYRLRGMATEIAYQKKGFGALLILAALDRLKELKSDLLWFNARLSAEKFYLRLGFEPTEEIFEIPLIGSHRVMFKWLQH